MIQYTEKLDPKKVVSELEETKKRYTFQLAIINALFEVLAGFEGKPISKRIETACKKHPALEGLTIYYDTNYGMFHLRVWGGNILYDNRMSILLGHQGSTDCVNLERIKGHNICYTLNAGRIKNLEAQKDKVVPLVNRWNEALKALQAVHAEAAKIEGLEYKLDIETRR